MFVLPRLIAAAAKAPPSTAELQRISAMILFGGGLIFILVGYSNIKNQSAGDQDWVFDGKSAVSLGWLRVGIGVAGIIGGIVLAIMSVLK